MAHRRVEGEGLRTSFDDAPDIRFITESDCDTHIEIEFYATPVGHDNASEESSEVVLGEKVAFGKEVRTRVIFGTVLECRWIDNDYQYLDSDSRDHAFALIEILDSERIRRILDSLVGERLLDAEGNDFGIRASDLRHFRISFDEFGTLDVVCLRLNIERIERPSPPDSS